MVASKFFAESIRFETFEPISVLVFVEGDVTVSLLLSSLLSKVRQYLGVPCESMVLARIGRDMLSLCFKETEKTWESY